MTNFSVPSYETGAIQQSSRRRIRRRMERISSLSVLLLVSCITIGQSLAFNTANPHSNRGSLRLQAATGADKGVTPPSFETYDRQEFEMQVGRVMDTLRDDYPNILVKDFDYSIYHSDLELIDPSGIHLHGLKNYESAIQLVHTMVGIFYCPDQSDVKFRMCFDKARQNIRIHWNARVVPKAIFGGYKTTLHLDGISIYELERSSGSITQHRLERLVMNDDQVVPENGIFAALRMHARQSQVDGVPSYHRNMEAMTKIGGVTTYNNIGGVKVNARRKKTPENTLRFQKNRGSLLFGEIDESQNDDSSSSSFRSFITASSSRSRLNSFSSDSASGDQTISHMDASNAAALEKKNMSRKKFGLKPIEMDEFLEIKKQVEDLAIQQQKKAVVAAAEAMELKRAKEQKQNRGGFLGKLFGEALKDTCESNYDCQRPQVCCDFGVKKMCCASGLHITDGFVNRQPQRVLVPVPIDNPNPYPGNDPRNRDPIYQ